MSPAVPGAAEELVRQEIRRAGAIPFERFMELALYAPGVGYYESCSGRIGKAGDFYTSVSVGEVFGFLLAAGLAGASADFGPFDWVEAGAHDGVLLRDVMTAMERFWPERAGATRFRVLEPSPAREALQRGNLGDRQARVTWARDWTGFPEGISGVVVSNELLDAFPVRRFGWDATSRRWWECGVTVRDDRLVGCRLPAETPLPDELQAALAGVLPDGYVVERCPRAEAWWAEAARVLRRGHLVAFDYGYDDAGRGLRPECQKGTARAYRGHRSSDELLEHVGRQDLTAHVDFARIIRAGEAEGLVTERLQPQGRWLGGVGARVLAGGGAAAAWLTERTRQFQTLVHPAHLGAALKVLMQGRGEVSAGEGSSRPG